MKRTILLLLIVLSTGLLRTVRAQDVAVKTNLLYDALLNVNAGVEVVSSLDYIWFVLYYFAQQWLSRLKQSDDTTGRPQKALRLLLDNRPSLEYRGRDRTRMGLHTLSRSDYNLAVG